MIDRRSLFPYASGEHAREGGQRDSSVRRGAAVGRAGPEGGEQEEERGSVRVGVERERQDDVRAQRDARGVECCKRVRTRRRLYAWGRLLPVVVSHGSVGARFEGGWVRVIESVDSGDARAAALVEHGCTSAGARQ